MSELRDGLAVALEEIVTYRKMVFTLNPHSGRICDEKPRRWIGVFPDGPA